MYCRLCSSQNFKRKLLVHLCSSLASGTLLESMWCLFYFVSLPPTGAHCTTKKSFACTPYQLWRKMRQYPCRVHSKKKKKNLSEWILLNGWGLHKQLSSNDEILCHNPVVFKGVKIKQAQHPLAGMPLNSASVL